VFRSPKAAGVWALLLCLSFTTPLMTRRDGGACSGNTEKSAESAPYTSLGRRPRLGVERETPGLKARPIDPAERGKFVVSENPVSRAIIAERLIRAKVIVGICTLRRVSVPIRAKTTENVISHR
jgi:hypothetical protein